jgi:protease-4
MKRFLLGFLIGLVFAGLALVIVAFAAVRLGNRPPTIADNSTLVIHLEGAIPEKSPVDVDIPFFSEQAPLTVAETWSMLRRAATDSHIKAVMIEPHGLSVGWAKLEELRGDLLAFKKSGKPVYAYLRGAGTREYYLATAADRVFMAETDQLDVKGVRAELTYVKGTLDKLGVKMEFQHVGKYKDAPDQLTKTGSSPETREVINGLLDQFYGDLMAKIADGRKKQPQQVRDLIDNGPFSGKEALAGGLVDALKFEDEAFGELKDKAKVGDNRISERRYARVPDPNAPAGSKIALLVGEGDITRGSTNPSGFGDEAGITASGMVKLLRQVREDSSIRGVILRVDSPGGDGIASDDILHEAKLLSQKKPMVISMSDLAASGGYFISMTGDPVLAYPNTETGSIGVFFGKVNLKGLYDKIGLNKEILTRGRFADIDTDYAPLTPVQSAKLQAEIEEFYKGFVERVSAARKRPYGEVEPLAQGRVWTGAQAKKNGLVDELGGLDRAIELIKDRAKLSSSDQVSLVPYPPRRSLVEMLLRRDDNSASILDARAIDSLLASIVESKIDAKVRTLLGNFPVRALSQGGMLQLMPYTITVE